MISIGPDAASSPFYQGQIPDPKPQHEKTGLKDVKCSEHDKEINVAYQDPSLPQTLELLEQRFLDEIMKLTKDQNDAEDEENRRNQDVCNSSLLDC